MKIAVTPFAISSIPKLIEQGADIIIAGNAKYANRLVKSYSDLEISEISNLVKSLGKELYIQMNFIVHNDQLEDLELYLDMIGKLDIDGIIFGDLAVYQIAKRKSLEHLLIYNPETLNTNYYDPIYWGDRGIKGLTIAKEISLDDIHEIYQKSPIEISIIGHGFLNMFHSRRPLIENFFKYRSEEYEKYLESRTLHLVEEIRNETYPVFQDEHGTHIFRDKAMESYKEIYQLQQMIDVFIIDGIFQDTEYLVETVGNYHTLLQSNQPDLADQISKKYAKDHDSGFLYKKTVYDKY